MGWRRCVKSGRERFSPLSRIEQSITGLYDRPRTRFRERGFATRSWAPCRCWDGEQGTGRGADKGPGNGRAAFGICFWGYLDRNLAGVLTSVVVICTVSLYPLLDSRTRPASLFSPPFIRSLYSQLLLRIDARSITI